ncbi:hypothetical protein [Streptomyces sp. NPDC055036]
MWQGQDLTEAAGIPEGDGQAVIHALIDAHAAMLARHEAELAPYKDTDGALSGNDYDDHDAVADRTPRRPWRCSASSRRCWPASSDGRRAPRNGISRACPDCSRITLPVAVRPQSTPRRP